MTSAAFLTALRLPRARRDTVTLVGRPHSPVAHLFVGPTTPSRRSVPRAVRTVCQAHTRRLMVLEPHLPGVVDMCGRRVCANCSTRLTTLASKLPAVVSRDDRTRAYGHLTMRDLVCALACAASTDDTHKVGNLALLLFGSAPVREALATTDTERRLFYLNKRIVVARQHFAALERTPEEVDIVAARREALAANEQLIRNARAKEARIERAIARRTKGQYVMPHERDLLATL